LNLFFFPPQTINQEQVSEDRAGRINSIVGALCRAFDLFGYAATLGVPNPTDFKWLAVMSWGAVAIASIVYTVWLRSERGHLIHFARKTQ
jgi:iron-regulated transporter 1